jgi:hypothetical protein
MGSMKLRKTITGSAGGFVFSLTDHEPSSTFMLRIEDESSDEHSIQLSTKKEKIEEFLEGCAVMLQKLRDFKPETP